MDRIFTRIDFARCYDGSVFGYWRYSRRMTSGGAPVVYLDANAGFRLTGAILQNHFAMQDLDCLAQGGPWARTTSPCSGRPGLGLGAGRDDLVPDHLAATAPS